MKKVFGVVVVLLGILFLQFVKAEVDPCKDFVNLVQSNLVKLDSQDLNLSAKKLVVIGKVGLELNNGSKSSFLGRVILDTNSKIGNLLKSKIDYLLIGNGFVAEELGLKGRMNGQVLVSDGKVYWATGNLKNWFYLDSNLEEDYNDGVDYYLEFLNNLLGNISCNYVGLGKDGEKIYKVNLDNLFSDDLGVENTFTGDVFLKVYSNGAKELSFGNSSGNFSLLVEPGYLSLKTDYEGEYGKISFSMWGKLRKNMFDINGYLNLESFEKGMYYEEDLKSLNFRILGGWKNLGKVDFNTPKNAEYLQMNNYFGLGF